MPNTTRVITQIAVIILLIIVASVGILYVLDFLSPEGMSTLLGKSLAVWGILTVLSFAISFVASGKK